MKARSRSWNRTLSRKAKVVGVVLFLLLCWPIFSISIAAGHGDYDSDLTVSDYASTSQAAATAAAAQHLQDGDAIGAEIFAKQALASSAISASALSSMGLAEQSMGHWRQAGAILSLASALGWRDAPAQLWLAQAHLQSHDYVQAAQRLDALLRMQPSDPPLFDIVDRLIADPKLAAAMADRLVLNPKWRIPYLGYAGDNSLATLRARAYLIIALARSTAPPSRGEILQVVGGFTKIHELSTARALWFEGQRKRPETPYDPSFQKSGSTGMMPFEWTLKPVLGASIQIGQDTRGDAATLHVTTDGSASGVLMQQMVLLSRGLHVLHYLGSIDPPARSAISWVIRCVATGKPVLDTLDDRSSQDYPLTIPDNCDSQFLELRVTNSPAAAGSGAYFNRLELN